MYKNIVAIATLSLCVQQSPPPSQNFPLSDYTPSNSDCTGERALHTQCFERFTEALVGQHRFKLVFVIIQEVHCTPLRKKEKEKTKIAAQWMFLHAVTGWEPGEHTHQMRFKLRLSTCHNFASCLPKLSVLCLFSMCLFAPNRPLHTRHPIISLLLNSLHHRRLVTTEN